MARLVESALRTFLRRVATLHVEFELYCVPATKLSGCIGEQEFDRIETSNIADHIYLGIADTIASLGPLLQQPRENRHATLITVFMNVIVQFRAGNHPVANHQGMRHAAEYLGLGLGDLIRLSPEDPKMVIFHEIASGLCGAEHWFQKYKDFEKFGFANAEGHGLAIKKRHTIIEEWPMRLKRKPNQPGAQEEFDMFLTAGGDGMERYVEWCRTE